MDVQQKYLDHLEITKNCNSKQLIEISQELLEILTNKQEFSPSKLLYAAAILRIILVILKDRNVNLYNVISQHDTGIISKKSTCIKKILQDPFKWCAIKLLTAANGEQILWNVFHADETGQFTRNIIDSTITNLAKNAILYKMAIENHEFRIKIESYTLLDQIQRLPSKNCKSAAVYNLLSFQAKYFTIEHLMNILLFESKNAPSYQIKQHIYQRLISLLSKRNSNFLRVFWNKINYIYCENRLVELFLQCLRLHSFYNCLSNQIIDYLANIETQFVDDFDVYISKPPFSTADVTFRDVCQLTNIFLMKKSPVQEKFYKLISEHVTDIGLKTELLQFLTYDT